jgi:hypothetical protein
MGTTGHTNKCLQTLKDYVTETKLALFAAQKEKITKDTAQREG